MSGVALWILAIVFLSLTALVGVISLFYGDKWSADPWFLPIIAALLLSVAQNRNKIYLNFTSDLIEMPKETQNLISYLEDPLEVSTASGPISSPKALQGGPRIINTKFINATQSAKLKSGLLMPIRIASK